MASTDQPEKLEIGDKSRAYDPTETEEYIERVTADQIDNYHGLTLKCVLVYLALLVLAFAQMLIIISTGLTGQIMAAEIGGSSMVLWLPQLILIVNIALASPFSQAADYWGRKIFLVSLSLVAIFGSIIVSRANSMGVALFGNFVAALVTTAQPITWTVASEIVPRRFRMSAQSGISLIYALGGITGLVGGSALGEINGGWRIVWYINAGLFALSAILMFIFYQPPVFPLQSSLTFREKLGRLDWVGISLLAPSLTLFVMALTWSDNPYSWSDGHILGPFIVGMIGILLLAVYEVRFKKDGLFHHGLFRHRNAIISLFAIGLEGLAFLGANTYFPMEVSLLGFETKSIMVGLRFATVFMVATPVSVLVAAYCTRARQLRLPLVVAFLCFCAFYGTMISVDLNDGKNVWGYLIFLGVGLGIVVPVCITALHLALPHELLSVSSGASLSARVLMAAIGLPIYGAIFNSGVRNHVPKAIAAAVLPLGLSESALPQFIKALSSHNPEAFAGIPGITQDIIHAGLHGSQLGYVQTYRPIQIAGLCFSFAGVIASCFVADPKDQFTMHVDAPLEVEVEVEDKNASSA